MPFSLTMPGQILFGRGEAAKAPRLIAAHGARGIIVHGADPSRAETLLTGLRAAGCELTAIGCPAEPTLEMLDDSIRATRPRRPQWVAAIGGGAALDLGKALAALIPQRSAPMDHLEVVGANLPLRADPLPFIAIPTTAGTGSEATKNAVIGLPDHGRKVSLRDDRMMARLAIVDPALTDRSPRAVTLASGLDAVVQVIEPYVSSRANPLTDALCRPAIARGLNALIRLMQTEDAGARDDLALTSLTGGIALANAGLGAVHGLAGVIGGVTGAAHGAICGALLAPVLAANSARASGHAAARLAEVRTHLAASFDTTEEQAVATLAAWMRQAGLPRLAELGLSAADHLRVAEASLSSSSMKGNPVPLDVAALCEIMAEA